MGYRGDDLDLRTPQSHGASHVDVGAWRDNDNNGLRGRVHLGGALNGPILVDETVLACCNHAYDVALAHGAAEVRLEHFLNALTRIDAAAEALEGRGVRVAALRRESAAVIAGEIPAGSARTVGSPRRTQEFEDVLRLAAAHAQRRNEAATVDDIVHVILEEEPNLPGLSLLGSVTTRRRRPLFDSLPQLPRASAGEGRNYLNDGLRSNRYRLPSQSYLTDAGNGNGHASSARMEQLEQTISNLIGDISADRKALAAAMQELQGEAMAQREEMIDGFNALNQAIHSARAPSIDLTPINDRVLSIGRETSGKLNALEVYMDKLISKPGADLSSIHKRLEAIEDIITARTEDHTPQIAHRLATLEETLTRAQARATEQHDGVLHELAQVSGRLEKTRSEVVVGVLTPLTERVERQRVEVQGLLQPMAERIERQRNEITTASLGPLAERIERLERLSQSADGHESRTSQALAGVLDRVSRLETSLVDWAQATQQTGAAYAKELGEVEEVLVKLNDGQRSASAVLGAWRQDGNNALQSLLSRVDVVEQQGARANSMLEQMAGIVERMYQVTAQRYIKRNRLKYWLFGTDDWISASWPSQASKINEAMAQARIKRT
jgi:hypothetical protein